MSLSEPLSRDPDHEPRALDAIKRVLRSVPFYAKQDLAGRIENAGSLAEALPQLPLLTREKIRPTLPKVWFPEGRDAKAELARGSLSILDAGSPESRIRVLFDPKAWRAQERRALSVNPKAARVLRETTEDVPEAVLWVPERGTGSCGAGDPTYEDRLEGARLHLNSRQDPTFWTEPVMTRMLDELLHHKTAMLLADPFYLDALTRHAASLGRRIDVHGFIATMRARATVAHRAALGRVYDGALLDVLAAREVGTLFVQSDDTMMHHAPFTTHVEFLRAKVPTPGAENVALLVVSTMEREIQPLLRYVLGDLVSVSPGEGRFTPVSPITSVEGSLDDALVRPDGGIVTPGAIDRAIGPAPRAYQVVQTDASSVEVLVVGSSPDDAAHAIAPLVEGMRLTARSATAIGVEPTGKVRTTRRAYPVSTLEAFAAAQGA
jgi:hypothetical protein